MYKKINRSQYTGVTEFVTMYQHLKYISSLLLQFIRARKRGESERYIPTLACCTSDAVLFYDIFHTQIGYSISAPSVAVTNHSVTVACVGSERATMPSSCAFSPDYRKFAVVCDNSLFVCNPARCVLSEKPVYVARKIKGIVWCDSALFVVSSRGTTVAIVDDVVVGKAEVPGSPTSITCFENRIAVATDDGMASLRLKLQKRDAARSFVEGAYKVWKSLDIEDNVISSLSDVPKGGSTLFTSSQDGLPDGVIHVEDLVSKLMKNTLSWIPESVQYVINDYASLGKKVDSARAERVLEILSNPEHLKKYLKPLPSDAQVILEAKVRKRDKSEYKNVEHYHTSFIKFLNQLLKRIAK